MAKLDGVSKELYPGEIEGFKRRRTYAPTHSAADWAALGQSKARARPDPKDDFTIRRERFVERKVASGHKIVYKNIGGFRG